MWRLLKKKGEKGSEGEKKGVKGQTKSPLPSREGLGEGLREEKSITKEGKSHLAHRVLLKPLVSEKSSKDSIYDTYGFVAERGANKIEIAKAFWALYNVRPFAVRTMLMPEKRKRTGRVRGIRPVWKKALVRVPKGSKVEIFKGV